MPYNIEQHVFEGGKVAIYKRPDHFSGIWQCRIRVGGDRRYWVGSTKTTDLNEAREFAMEKYWETKTLKRHGDLSKLWARPFDKVAAEYVAYTQKRVASGIDSLACCRFGGHQLKLIRPSLRTPLGSDNRSSSVCV